LFTGESSAVCAEEDNTSPFLSTRTSPYLRQQSFTESLIQSTTIYPGFPTGCEATLVLLFFSHEKYSLGLQWFKKSPQPWKEEKLTLNYLATALVDIPVVSMSIAHSLKT
jgi:hypothetical protein